MKKKITMTLITAMVLSVLAACGDVQEAGTDLARSAIVSGEIGSGEDRSNETGEVKVENAETGNEVPEETIQEETAEEVKEAPGEEGREAAAEDVRQETTEPVKVDSQKTTADNVTSSTIPPMNSMFDAGYYAQVYPDLAEAFGNNEALLWKHYVEFGEREGRKCYDGDPGGSIVVNGQTAQAVNDIAAPANDTATPSNDTAASSNEVSAPADSIAADQYAQIMLEQINAYRAENGIAPLEFRQDCLDVANIRVWEMTSLMSHTRPNGKRFYTAYDDCGYHILKCAENISVHHSDWDFDSEGDINVYVEHFMNNFKNSASHNATMLNAKWKYVGFAFVTNYDGNCYVAQEFTN